MIIERGWLAWNFPQTMEPFCSRRPPHPPSPHIMSSNDRTINWDKGHFLFNPKFRKFQKVHQVEWTNGPNGLVLPEYSKPALKLVHFVWLGYLGRSVGRKCPFPFDKIAAPSTALLPPAYKINNQTCSGLGRVCATTPLYVHVEFLKFLTRIFVAWKAAKVLSTTKMSLPMRSQMSWSQWFMPMQEPIKFDGLLAYVMMQNPA